MSASQVIRIRARNGQSERLGLRLQQLVEPGLEAPGCLEYQVRRDALEPDLWLVCSQWREAQQMFDYLASQPRVHQVGVAGVERGREDEAAPAELVQFQALVARLGTILYAEQLVAEQGERL